MTLIVETGEGVSGANSYVGLGFARRYLEDRNKATDWNSATADVREAALIEATQYVDMTFGHRFKGSREFTSMERFARNFVHIETLPVAATTFTIGDQTYTFVASVSSANDVLIGSSIADTLQNMVYAINASGGTEGTEWGTGTTENEDVSATLSESGEVLILTAKTSGEAANSVAVTTTSTGVRIDTSTLSGGAEPGTQPLEFPRSYLYDRSGVIVDGIPEKLKMAIVEYAERARAASLLPDPTYDPNGRLVTRETKQVGPIKTETRWTEGGDIIITRKYPFADRMLHEYMSGVGGVIR